MKSKKKIMNIQEILLIYEFHKIIYQEINFSIIKKILTNNNNNNNNNDRNNKNFNIPSLDNFSDNGEHHDENDLGVDVIYSDSFGKVYKLTDLIIPLYDSKKNRLKNILGN